MMIMCLRAVQTFLLHKLFNKITYSTVSSRKYQIPIYVIMVRYSVHLVQAKLFIFLIIPLLKIGTYVYYLLLCLTNLAQIFILVLTNHS